MTKNCSTAPNDTCSRFGGLLRTRIIFASTAPLLLGCWSIKNGEVIEEHRDWDFDYYVPTTVLEGKYKHRCSVGCCCGLSPLGENGRGWIERLPRLGLYCLALLCHELLTVDLLVVEGNFQCHCIPCIKRGGGVYIRGYKTVHPLLKRHIFWNFPNMKDI